MHIIKKNPQSIKSGCESFSGRFGHFGSLLSGGSLKRECFPPKHTRQSVVHCPDWSLFNPFLPMSAELGGRTNAAANHRNSTWSVCATRQECRDSGVIHIRSAGAARSHDHGRNYEIRQQQPRPKWQRDVNNSLILRFFALHVNISPWFLHLNQGGEH